MSDAPETTEAPETAEVTEATETPAETPETDDLGDAGKKAIKAERDARKAAEKELSDMRDEVARLRRTNAAVKGVDVDAIKAEIRTEFAGQNAEFALKAEAKGRLTNPADALAFIDLSPLHGADEAAYTKAVDDLLKERPYLAAQNSPSWGDVGGGNRNSADPEPASALDRMARAYSNTKK